MRRKISISLFICIVFSCSGVWGQAVEIPEELKENANSIIIENRIDFVCESPTSGVKKETLYIMIMNEKGKDEGNFYCVCDKFTSLRKFSGEIYDRTGRSIRKLKKSDLRMTEYSSGLKDDNYMYYYECNGPSYPYIVKYEWEIKDKDGLIGFPSFVPQSVYNQSVVKANYNLTVPQGMKYKYKAINTDVKPEEKSSESGKSTTLEVAFTNLKALENEPYGPSMSNLIPRFYFSPVDFFFDGSKGSLESWKTFGLWQYELLKGRDVLPEPFKQKLKEIAANYSTDREKVKAVYDYLGETTRYVSIQLGIGGLQPIPAMEVNKTGFGDCKGLSNYAMAMLGELGIKSTYTAISTNNSRLIKDYASANQMNHVVLQVPLENDTLWLECTNPQLPFGYVHNDIAGHDALLIKETGGEIYRLPTYADSVNTQVTHAEIELDATGKATVHVKQTSRAFQYESMSGITQLTPDKQKDFLRYFIKLTKASVNNISINETKDANPAIDIKYDIHCDQYGNKTGNRLFIPVNVFRDRFSNMKQKERKYDIFINYGYMDSDTINIKIPDGHKIEALPKPSSISGQFGTFTTVLKVDEQNNSIQVTHSLLMKAGRYPAEIYKEFVEYSEMISKQYRAKIILRKE